MRYELTDLEWSIIQPMLPAKSRGVPGVDDRRMLYQRRQLPTVVSPIPESDGHDRFRLIDELVPGLAPSLDDCVVIFENAVREPVLPKILPDVLDRVQLG